MATASQRQAAIVIACVIACSTAGFAILRLSSLQAPSLLKGLCSAGSAHNEVVQWDANKRRCVPNVCQGAFLPDLPDVPGRLPMALLCHLKLFDAAAARQCLMGKRLVLLGDSTMGARLTLSMRKSSSTPPGPDA